MNPMSEYQMLAVLAASYAIQLEAKVKVLEAENAELKSKRQQRAPNKGA
jgi:adenylate kinase